MKTSMCVLCDRATVREGLVHVLGGGITRLGRPELPAPMAADLAVVLTPERFEELSGKHRLVVTLRSQEEVNVATLLLRFSFADLSESVDPIPSIPLSIPLQQVMLPAHGFYTAEVSYDGEPVSQLRFVVQPQPAAGATEMLPAAVGAQ